MEWTTTLRNVLLGASVLGAAGGVLGSYTLLRRQSLLGDALAHAALPGVCLAYLWAGRKDSGVLLAGAALAGIAGALAIVVVVRFSRVKEDSAIGIVLSVFFGAGIVLLTFIQRLPLGTQSGLDHFLFGQAATLLASDVVLVAALASLALGVVALFYKEFKLLVFDRDFGASLGFSMRATELLLTAVLVLVIVVGLRTVGVVLMVATLVTPAAAARQWTDRLGAMLILAAVIGAGSGAGGALVSAAVERMPTGPVIVLISSGVLVVSLLAAPRRGLVQALVRERRAARGIRIENLLKDLYRLTEAPDGPAHASWPEVMGMRGQSGRELARVARRLERDGLIRRRGDRLELTARGRVEAERVVRKHRLWEVYLTRRLDLPSDHVHRDAEAMEHALSDEAVERIDALLGFPEVDPHGRPIPRPTPRPARAGRQEGR